MKLKLTVILVCALLAIPFSLAYWDNSLTVKNTSSKINIPIGTFTFDSTKGAKEWKPGQRYNMYDLIIKDGKYYIVVRPEICGDQGGCPDPNGPINPYYSAYASAGISWSPRTKYIAGSIVEDDNVLYRAVNEGNANSTKPSVGGNLSWTPIESINFSSKYYYTAGSYLISEEKIVKLQSDIYPGSSTIPQWAIAKSFNETYLGNKSYRNGDAVYYNNGVFIVKDQEKANQSIPGTIYGAWQRIDTLEWQSFNTYAKGAIVRYNGHLYESFTENRKSIPGTVINEWRILDTLDYDAKSVYTFGDVVVYNNTVYHAIKVNSGTLPGSIKDEGVWQKH